MAKKIKLKPYYTVEEWHDKIRRTRDNGHKLKMLVIEKILSNPNISGEEIQKIFFISKATMYSWIKQYTDNGLEGLKAENPKGRGSGKGNLKVPDEVYIALKEQIEQSNKKWTLKEQQAYLKKEFGHSVTQQAIAYRMKKL